MILSGRPPIDIKQENEKRKGELLPSENAKQEETNEQRMMIADLVCTLHVIYTLTTSYFLVII